MTTIDERVEALDLGLFDAIPSQTQEGDRNTLLAIQREVRKQGEYAYLEIGSHLGGTIQPYYADPRCKLIYSIDKRPLVQPDDRGSAYAYPENSTQQMIENLKAAFPEADHEKLITFDCDAREVQSDTLRVPPDICFIDGEHTHEAVLSDFNFCKRYAKNNAPILLHDAGVTIDAILAIKEQLKQQGWVDPGRKLGGSVYAFLLSEEAGALQRTLNSLAVNEEHYFKGARYYLNRQKNRARLRNMPLALKGYDLFTHALDRTYKKFFRTGSS